jgi:hypothetical protein
MQKEESRISEAFFIHPFALILLGTIIRGLGISFCTAGGIPEPKFQQVSNPEQILSARELARFEGVKEGNS